MRVRPETLLPLEPTGHEFDHGEADQGEGGSGQVFEVASEATAAGDPRQRSLDDPSLRQHLEALGGVRTLDDLEAPRTGFTKVSSGPFTLVAAVGEDFDDEGEHRPRLLVEKQRRWCRRGCRPCSCRSVLWALGSSRKSQQTATQAIPIRVYPLKAVVKR